MSKNEMEFLDAEIKATRAKTTAILLAFEQYQLDTHAKPHLGPLVVGSAITEGTKLVNKGKTPALELSRQLKMLDNTLYIVNKKAPEGASQIVESAMKIVSQHTLEEIEEMRPKFPKHPQSAITPEAVKESIELRKRAAQRG